ncbi:YggS family pyridoxal phosphate-dependent enzyme [Staphylococcus sp. SQ8-PEA]|uniref:Pyridoxal phosphate homeostasis protein n=1 Tax=Staphylococcus marylandisciuri TaxID=2981529 RepID=A0ABT2QP24_9STAP|nr:YggS family pyridoxal phosphate-dependent enzyme [Staphylococcus marylandisciuri]MCU5745724.1 YggS family pyridoxal phosphate-dependent enzyme [Staphylococcus marylandisciuri]
MTVKYNLEQIQKEISERSQKAKRSTQPNVIAVTKYVTIDRAKEAYAAGIRHFGENRVEGFLEKKAALPDDAIMHFIGPLQSRKVKEVVREIDYYHALDRLKIAKEIDKRADHQVKCFVQVNISGESTKHGLELTEVKSFIQSLADYSNIKVVGLMTMAPYTEDEIYIKQIFEKLKKKRDEIQSLNLKHAPCSELSMGMSNDYLLAIEEGASYVRIGTKLVGDKE